MDFCASKQTDTLVTLSLPELAGWTRLQQMIVLISLPRVLGKTDCPLMSMESFTGGGAANDSVPTYDVHVASQCSSPGHVHAMGPVGNSVDHSKSSARAQNVLTYFDTTPPFTQPDADARNAHDVYMLHHQRIQGIFAKELLLIIETDIQGKTGSGSPFSRTAFNRLSLRLFSSCESGSFFVLSIGQASFGGGLLAQTPCCVTCQCVCLDAFVCAQRERGGSLSTDRV